MLNQLVPDSVWYFVSQHSHENECHCQCGETFYSHSLYIGKKTGCVSHICCPGCGSYQMAYVIPAIIEKTIPKLKSPVEVKRRKFKRHLVRLDLSESVI